MNMHSRKWSPHALTSHKNAFHLPHKKALRTFLLSCTPQYWKIWNDISSSSFGPTQCISLGLSLCLCECVYGYIAGMLIWIYGCRVLMSAISDFTHVWWMYVSMNCIHLLRVCVYVCAYIHETLYGNGGYTNMVYVSYIYLYMNLCD